MATDMDEREVTISGVKVVFPCKPYPSQFGMMDRVIKGIQRKQNSLLESPTGSGKSLALLCSALAWQFGQHEKYAKEQLMETSDADCCKPCHCGAKDNQPKEYSPESKPGQGKVPSTKRDGGVDKPLEPSDDDEDFKPSVAKFRTPVLGKNRRHISISYDSPEVGHHNATQMDSPVKPAECTCGNDRPTGKRPKIPKIYFGTRTHKQIAQIARELKKTAYHNVSMVILASREHTCVHPEVSLSRNKNEGCRELLDPRGVGCRWNDRAKRVFLNQSQLQDILDTAWDLEDFVHACKCRKACPYFVTRNIKDEADIVFCPYNYLVDPLVRKSMEINVKDQIVILDEAHNIEDCAREAASASLTSDHVAQAVHNLQEMINYNIKVSDHLTLKKMMESVLQFMEESSHNMPHTDYDQSYKTWSGFDIVARLKVIGLGPERFSEYQMSLKRVTEPDEDQPVTVRNQHNKEVKLGSSTTSILEQLLQVLDYMYRDDMKYVEDYRVAIMKTKTFVNVTDTNNLWMTSRSKKGKVVPSLETSLNFWCMNPAVAFSDFATSRNVVLSSGTLSPMSTFSSELGAPFPIQLEANHIIQDKQVWVGAVGQGPGGCILKAVYNQMERLDFQDELGNLVYQVCMNVPHGVLCFLPSYRALHKFVERWKTTQLWEKISSRKRVMVEPRSSERLDFDGLMKSFYSAVEGDTSCDIEDKNYPDGAIFFAVCRGKVSEGMDFTDNNARAVITVGIPFPSIKDLQVKLKREYNDKHRSDRGLLSGSEWYEIQAYRALNQALGRCIRHRKDWGALIMVDDRFVKQTEKYCKGLSKWVRSKVMAFTSFSQTIASLSNFTQRMVKEMPVVSADTSFIPCTPGDRPQSTVYKNKSLDGSLVSTPKYLSDYKNKSLDDSLVSTPKYLSDFFKPLHHGGINPQSLPPSPFTPNTAKEDNSRPLQSIPVTHEVPPQDVHSELMNIINSPSAPKEPYFIILNQGLPGETKYLIKPNKCAKEQEELELAAKQQKELKDSEKEQKKMLEQLMSVVKSVDAPTDKPFYVVLNQGSSNETKFLVDPSRETLPNRLHNEGLQNPQVVLDPSLHVIGVPAAENREIVPLTENREMVPLARRLAEKAQNKSTAWNVSLPNGITPIVTKFDAPANTSDTMCMDQTKESKHSVFQVYPSNNTVTPSKIPLAPVTPHKVPIATVMPQKVENIKTEPITSTNDHQNEIKQHYNQVVGHENISKEFTEHLVNEIGKPSGRLETTSPLLFDDEIANKDASVANLAALVEPVNYETPSIKKKKPIFKRTSLSRSKTICYASPPSKALQEKTDPISKNLDHQFGGTQVSDRGDDKHEPVKVKDAPTSDIMNSDKAQIMKVRCATRGTVNKTVAETMRKIRQTSTEHNLSESEEDAKTTNKSSIKTDRPSIDIKTTGGVTQIALDSIKKEKEIEVNEKAAEDDMDEGSDDFLNTRRRKGGRKRRSSSTFKLAKRSKPPVEYMDEIEKIEEYLSKVSETTSKIMCCSKCGATIVKQPDYEKRRRHPNFMKSICNRNTELLFFKTLDIQATKLQPVAITRNSVELNSCVDQDSDCCVEFLQCTGCAYASSNPTPLIVGARVKYVGEKADFQAGQTWLLASSVKF